MTIQSSEAKEKRTHLHQSASSKAKVEKQHKKRQKSCPCHISTYPIHYMYFEPCMLVFIYYFKFMSSHVELLNTHHSFEVELFMILCTSLIFNFNGISAQGATYADNESKFLVSFHM